MTRFTPIQAKNARAFVATLLAKDHEEEGFMEDFLGRHHEFIVLQLKCIEEQPDIVMNISDLMKAEGLESLFVDKLTWFDLKDENRAKGLNSIPDMESGVNPKEKKNISLPELDVEEFKQALEEFYQTNDKDKLRSVVAT